MNRPELDAIMAARKALGTPMNYVFGYLDIDKKDVMIPFPFISFDVLQSSQEFSTIVIMEPDRESHWHLIHHGDGFMPYGLIAQTISPKGFGETYAYFLK